jgi:hypothetical protein
MKVRRRVLNLIKKKYSGSKQQRFGPTLAAEHLAEEDGIVVDHETLRRWMLAEHLWSRQRKGRNTANGGNGKNISASWCSWMGVFTIGSKSVVHGAVS